MVPHEFSGRVLLGTANAGKFRELSRYAEIFGFTSVGLNDPALSNLVASPIVAEILPDYAGNAEAKALAYARWSGLSCLADDTGLEVDILNGFPGIFTARWGVARVSSIIGVHRSVRARFVCAMSYAEPGGRVVTTSASVAGELRGVGDMIPQASRELPFSDYFFPDGAEKPLGVLIQEGYLGSHRYRALSTMLEVLG